MSTKIPNFVRVPINWILALFIYSWPAVKRFFNSIGENRGKILWYSLRVLFYVGSAIALIYHFGYVPGTDIEFHERRFDQKFFATVFAVIAMRYTGRMLFNAWNATILEQAIKADTSRLNADVAKDCNIQVIRNAVSYEGSEKPYTGGVFRLGDASLVALGFVIEGDTTLINWRQIDYTYKYFKLERRDSPEKCSVLKIAVKEKGDSEERLICTSKDTSITEWVVFQSPKDIEYFIIKKDGHEARFSYEEVNITRGDIRANWSNTEMKTEFSTISGREIRNRVKRVSSVSMPARDSVDRQATQWGVVSAKQGAILSKIHPGALQKVLPNHRPGQPTYSVSVHRENGSVYIAWVIPDPSLPLFCYLEDSSSRGREVLMSTDISTSEITGKIKAVYYGELKSVKFNYAEPGRNFLQIKGSEITELITEGERLPTIRPLIEEKTTQEQREEANPLDYLNLGGFRDPRAVAIARKLMKTSITKKNVIAIFKEQLEKGVITEDEFMLMKGQLNSEISKDEMGQNYLPEGGES